MKKKLAIIVIPASLLSLISVAGCEQYKDERGRGDAPVAAGRDDTPAHVINFPDNFGNVAWKCVGPDKVFVSSRSGTDNSSSLVVTPNRKDCEK